MWKLSCRGELGRSQGDANEGWLLLGTPAKSPCTGVPRWLSSFGIPAGTSRNSRARCPHRPRRIPAEANEHWQNFHSHPWHLQKIPFSGKIGFFVFAAFYRAQVALQSQFSSSLLRLYKTCQGHFAWAKRRLFRKLMGMNNSLAPGPSSSNFRQIGWI